MRGTPFPLVLLLLCACARGPSPADVDRSMRELQLASSLREEGQTPGAITHLRKALELDPDNAEAYVLLGFIYMERGDYPTADAELERAIKVLVKTERQGAILAEARNIRGRCLIAMGRYKEAIALLEQSANDELNTAPHLAWGNLALAKLRVDDLAGAVAAATRAVKAQARFCVGYYTLGQALFRLNRLAEAEAALVKAIEADETCKTSPQLQGAWQLRGETRARLGHRHDAIADLEKCIELGPNTVHGKACQQLLDSDR